MIFRIAKPNTTVLVLLLLGAGGSAIPMLAFFHGYFLYGLFFLVVWLWSLGSLVNLCLINRLVVNKSGVEYIKLRKRYKMSWDEIKIVGIGYMPIKQPGRPKMIYFSADGISCPILYGRVVDKSFYMINYRKMIVEEIRKYWLKEIDGLESKSDFEKRSNMKKKLT